MQHSAVAVFDKEKKKWSLHGKGPQFDVATLGIIASRRFGARAIQLPNRTTKVVAGVIDGNELVNLFGTPEQN